MERLKVVARYKDGKVIKGFTHDFFPNKDRFHLFPPDNPDPLPIVKTKKWGVFGA